MSVRKFMFTSVKDHDQSWIFKAISAATATATTGAANKTWIFKEKWQW